MKRIDRETVQRILDTADIVDVIGDFVSLKRKGTNFMGLCPFHNERTPSFSVSRTKQIFKCFSCGKSGRVLSFVMDHEQLSYTEALRYLAKKYNIEIHEHEMSEKEREEESERESMLAINEFALQHFKQNLLETPDGKAIGLSYFQERGISDAMIQKFQLGYALDQRDALYNAAISQGYNEKFLLSTGLCGKSDNGKPYDKYKGRVIFPIFGISGKAIAFGGRTLSARKDIAKYVNSQESIIYHKSNVLYGLYQAKQSIMKYDRCILVEGYMDVISMFQSGIENVVASSGTSLTEGQIRLIHRFTENILVIYDGDAAGIKASLRGIDMLLAEGMNVKVLLLPDGDDPDSFAKKHSSQEFVDYIKENETDFMRFKTSILLQGLEDDPMARSRVINDIVRSISVIPDSITRAEYVKSCSRMLEIDDTILIKQVNKFVTERIAKEAERNQRKQATDSIESIIDEGQLPIKSPDNNATEAQQSHRETPKILYKIEAEVLRYAIKYGLVEIGNEYDENANSTPLSLISYIKDEMEINNLSFSVPIFQQIFDEALEIKINSWPEDINRHNQELLTRRQQEIIAGEDKIKREAKDLSSINALEKMLLENVDKQYLQSLNEYTIMYLEKALSASPEDAVRDITIKLTSERHTLSKVHTKYSKIETEQDRLVELVPRAIYEWKDALIALEIDNIRQRIKEISSQPDPDGEELQKLLQQNIILLQKRSEFAKEIGDRVITPRK